MHHWRFKANKIFGYCSYECFGNKIVLELLADAEFDKN